MNVFFYYMRGSVLNHSVNWLFYSEFFIFELWNWKWLVEKLYQQNVVHSMWVLNMLKGSLSNIVWERKNEFFCLLYICSLTMLIPSCRFWGGGVASEDGIRSLFDWFVFEVPVLCWWYGYCLFIIFAFKNFLERAWKAIYCYCYCQTADVPFIWYFPPSPFF